MFLALQFIPPETQDCLQSILFSCDIYCLCAPAYLSFSSVTCFAFPAVGIYLDFLPSWAIHLIYGARDTPAVYFVHLCYLFSVGLRSFIIPLILFSPVTSSRYLSICSIIAAYFRLSSSQSGLFTGINFMNGYNVVVKPISNTYSVFYFDDSKLIKFGTTSAGSKSAHRKHHFIEPSEKFLRSMSTFTFRENSLKSRGG